MCDTPGATPTGPPKWEQYRILSVDGLTRHADAYIVHTSLTRCGHKIDSTATAAEFQKRK